MTATKERRKAFAFRMTDGQFMEAQEAYLGGCRYCGSVKEECEPDARRYPCDVCGKNHVYGFSELLLMGEVEIVESPGMATVEL